jgi:hypothetical protein
MLLWKNVIVVIAMLALATAPAYRLARSEWERSLTLKLAAAGAVMASATLSFLPEPLCQLMFGCLLLLCLDRHTPMIATYLFFLLWTPSATGYLVVGGTYIAPLGPIVSFSLALLVGYQVHPLMRLRRAMNAADFYLIAFLIIFSVCASLRSTGATILRNLLIYTVPYWLSYHILSRVRIERPEMVLRMLVYGGAAAGALCVFEALRYWPIYSGLAQLKGVWALLETTNVMLFRGGLFRSLGPFAHPLTASAVLGMAGIALFGLVRLRGFTPPVIMLALAVMAGLMATVSRTGIVMLFVGLATMQLFRKRYASIVAVTLFGCILLFGTPLLSGQDAQANGAYRIALLAGVPKALGAKLWLGYREAVQSHLLDAFVQGEGIVDLVNVYLSIAVNGGIVSLIPYLFFLGTSFTQYRALLRSGPTEPQLVLAQSCIAMQTGFAVSGLFMSAWGTPMQISFLCVAIIVALRAEVKTHRQEAPKPARQTILQTDFDRLPALS